MNIFRLPVGWQYLVNYLGGDLNDFFYNTYDPLVQKCLQTAQDTKCIIDIHNYGMIKHCLVIKVRGQRADFRILARWDGGIIGQQGGPSNDDFASLWTHLASYYANQPNIVMGIMNEPHELEIYAWATTLQVVVNAIRYAGAGSQWILLPGTGYSSAGDFKYSSGDALSGVRNPDDSFNNLFFDVHRYYNDYNNCSPYCDCVSDRVDQFDDLAKYLRGLDNGNGGAGRMALISETGGLNSLDCVYWVCSALTFVNQNCSDVFLGWIGWGAGNLGKGNPDNFDALNELDTSGNDLSLLTNCISGSKYS